MNVVILVENSKVNKKGFAPVSYQFYISGSAVKIASGESVDIRYWDKEKSECTRLHANYQYLNAIIKNQANFIVSEYLRAKAVGIEPIEKHIKTEFQLKYTTAKTKASPSDKNLFFDMFDEWVVYKSSLVSQTTDEQISEATIKSYKACINYFKAFQEATNVKLSHSNIDDEIYAKISQWHNSKAKSSANTFGKYMKILKQYLNWSKKKLKAKGITIENTWEDFYCPDKYMGADYLRPEEIKLLYTVDLSPGLDRTRKYFLAQMSTGQHYEESFLHICKKMLNYENRIIQHQRIKTSEPVIIPLVDDELFKPNELLNALFDENGNIPPLSISTINFNLVHIAKVAGIDRIKLTTKVARKTFASIQVFYYKKQPRIIMQITGHKSESEFARYLGVDVQDFAKLFEG
jgi:hypothetical protein